MFDSENDEHEHSSPPKRTVMFVLKRTVREFIDDGSTDSAAALTYFSVLSIFPGLLVVLSLVGLVGQADESVETIREILAPLVSPERLESITGILNDLVSVEGAGAALVVGVVGALWSASGYVGAFSRVMNRIYEVEEGRPFWRKRPIPCFATYRRVSSPS